MATLPPASRDMGKRITIYKAIKLGTQTFFFICEFIQYKSKIFKFNKTSIIDLKKWVLMNSFDSQSKSGSPSASTPLIGIS